MSSVAYPHHADREVAGVQRAWLDTAVDCDVTVQQFAAGEYTN